MVVVVVVVVVVVASAVVVVVVAVSVVVVAGIVLTSSTTVVVVVSNVLVVVVAGSREGPPTHEGNRIRPRADRGASDPQRSSEPPQGATVEERDDFRDNVLRDDSSRDNGHGRHEFAPPTAASRRGAVHDPVSTNEGRRGSWDAGGRQGALGAARGA